MGGGGDGGRKTLREVDGVDLEGEHFSPFLFEIKNI